MIYSYTTLLNEKAELLRRRKELKQVEDGNEEISNIIQQIDCYIEDIESALELLDEYAFEQ